MGCDCVTVKDNIIGVLNNCSGDKVSLREVIRDIIIPVFKWTPGLWVELHYEYKAIEILDRAMREWGIVDGDTDTLSELKGLRDKYIKEQNHASVEMYRARQGKP